MMISATQTGSSSQTGYIFYSPQTILCFDKDSTAICNKNEHETCEGNNQITIYRLMYLYVIFPEEKSSIGKPKLCFVLTHTHTHTKLLKLFTLMPICKLTY